MVDDEAKQDREKKRAERANKDQKRVVKRGEGNDEEEDCPDNELLENADAWLANRENWSTFEADIEK